MYFVGIDISKYKHDACIIDKSGNLVCNPFSFYNTAEGFQSFLTVLNSLDNPEEIRIGFEATSHYSINLKCFLAETHHSFMEINPLLVSEFKKSVSLRRTKTDTIDSEYIAKWLMTVDYKPCSHEFYHTYVLKSLTRLRESYIQKRSQYKVSLTNVLDHTFPEFKPFFNNEFSVTALYLLENYGSADRIAHMNTASYDKIRKVSRGQFSIEKFIALKKIASESVGYSNPIFATELSSILRLLRSIDAEIQRLEEEITVIITEINPKLLSIKGIGPISAAVIYAEFGGDFSKFSSPDKMLAFAGLEPGRSQSGTKDCEGRMVKRGSTYLRKALMNCTLPLVKSNMVFAAYYYKKREEGKAHRVAQSHVVKKLLRVIYTLETRQISFDSALLR